MPAAFPLHIDLSDNNCTVFGNNKSAFRRVRELLKFGAKVTVISPSLSPELAELHAQGLVRHIPRKYYRGDCTNSQLCIAATDDPAINIAISTECKAKGIPVSVTNPAAYGNFTFPRVVMCDDVVLSVSGNLPSEQLRQVCARAKEALPMWLEEIRNEAEKSNEE